MEHIFLIPRYVYTCTKSSALLYRDVNETQVSRVLIFFLITGKEFLDFGESRLATARQQAYSEWDNCHLLLHACYQSIACLLHRNHGQLTRRTDAAKQRKVAYLSGRGSRCFCCQALITIVTPQHRPSSANTTASVCR